MRERRKTEREREINLRNTSDGGKTQGRSTWCSRTYGDTSNTNNVGRLMIANTMMLIQNYNNYGPLHVH